MSNWRRSTLAELTRTWTSWQEVKSIAQGRVRWRSTEEGPGGGIRKEKKFVH